MIDTTMSLLKKIVNKDIDYISPIKQIIQGTLIVECGGRQLMDVTTQDLKQDVNHLVNVSIRIQNKIKIRCGNDKVFDKIYSSGSPILLAEIVELLMGVDEESLENILSQLKSLK